MAARTRQPARGRKARIAAHNQRLTRKLAVVAVLMFGFGFALVPLYDVFCDITGLGGKTGGQVEVAAVEALRVDTSRTVTVEFTGHANTGLPWEFRPLTKKLDVHPGATHTVKFYARNTVGEAITGQAVPSITPGKVATHFQKLECFCFTQQTLKPGEAKEMAVQFVVNPELSKDVRTLTLSYAFFNIDKASAEKYGGAHLASEGKHGAHGAHLALGANPTVN